MKYRFVTIALVTTYLVTAALASDSKKWGRVEPTYLQMKVYPEDTSAAAIKIFDMGEIDLRLRSEIELNFVHHYQIKILKESAKSFADVRIPYWHKDKIIKIKAHTITATGEKLKVKKFYDEEFEENYKVKKFTFPQVEVGSILEVEYKLFSSYFSHLEPWTFHDRIPTLESVVRLRISPGFKYNSKVQNDPPGRVQFSSEQYMDREAGMTLEQFFWRAENLPAIKEEPFISSLTNYKAKLIFQMIGFQNPYVNYNLGKDLVTLCNELLDDRYGDFLKPSKDVKEYTKGLIGDATSNEVAALRLYEHVRDEFEDESDETYYPRKKQNEILERKKGSVSERNLLLLSMLRAAGYNALPVLISTRSNGRIDPELPFLNQYNRSIVLIQINQAFYVLDASDRFCEFGQLPPNSLVESGLVVQKDNPQFVSNPNNDLRSTETFRCEISLDPDANVFGRTSIESTGYACRRRNWQLERSSDVQQFLTEEIGDDLPTLQITDADTALQAVACDTFSTDFDFELPEFAEVIDDEIYLRPALFNHYKRNAFVSEKREFPVEFGYCSKSTEFSKIYIPDGFEVTEKPQSLLVENPYFLFRRVITHYGDHVTYLRVFEMKEHFVPPSDYTLLKQDYARIVDADQEQIIFRSTGNITRPDEPPMVDSTGGY